MRFLTTEPKSNVDLVTQMNTDKGSPDRCCVRAKGEAMVAGNVAAPEDGRAPGVCRVSNRPFVCLQCWCSHEGIMMQISKTSLFLGNKNALFLKIFCFSETKSVFGG